MTDYTPYARNKCLHCQTVVKLENVGHTIAQYDFGNERPSPLYMFSSPKDHIGIATSACPECGKMFFSLFNIESGQGKSVRLLDERVIWPLSGGRLPAPPEVPGNIGQDYNEAAIVLHLSPKASAALSRRCLQTVLRIAGHTKSDNLSKQIDEVLPSLPSFVAENLDAVRQIGNFAAHEQKSVVTGAILDVEQGEAEWNLDVLDALFDFYFVRPEVERKKRDGLNKKLAEAGKPPLKET